MLEFMKLYRENCRKTPRMEKEFFLLNKSKEIWSFIRILHEERQEEIREMLLTKRYEDYLILEERFFLEE